MFRGAPETPARTATEGASPAFRKNMATAITTEERVPEGEVREEISSGGADFELLGLSQVVLKSVRDAGYQVPTPIQQQAIPLILNGRDVMGLAQTGTGKTAAF